MTPLQIEILFWYRCRSVDYREGDFSAPAVRAAIDEFRDRSGLLEPWPEGEKPRDWFTTYRLTARANAFLDHVCALPLPVHRWEMPAADAEGHRSGKVVVNG